MNPLALRFWPALPFLLLGTALLGWGWMVRLALADPGFAVERDYYRQAVEWDQQRALLEASARLGWTATWSDEPAGDARLLRLNLRDAERRPVEGATLDVEAFANARSNQRRRLEFVERAPGVYEATLVQPRPGLWELRLVAARDDARFLTRERRMLGDVR